MSLRRAIAEDARGHILRLLREATGYVLNEASLKRALSYVTLEVPGDVLRTHLHWLREQDLIRLKELTIEEGPQRGQTLLVATLTEAGGEVAVGRQWPGVARPEPR